MHFDNVMVTGGDNVMVAEGLKYDCLDIDKSKTMKLFYVVVYKMDPFWN